MPDLHDPFGAIPFHENNESMQAIFKDPMQAQGVLHQISCSLSLRARSVLPVQQYTTDELLAMQPVQVVILVAPVGGAVHVNDGGEIPPEDAGQ